MKREDMLSIIDAVLNRLEAQPENACLWWDNVAPPPCADAPVARYAVPCSDAPVARYAVPCSDAPVMRYAVVPCSDAPVARYAVPV